MKLDAIAEAATIFTAAVAGIAYGRYRLTQYTLRKRLERSLAERSPKYMDELIQELWMSEAEIFEAIRASKGLETGIDPGAPTLASHLWVKRKGENPT